MMMFLAFLRIDKLETEADAMPGWYILANAQSSGKYNTINQLQSDV